VLDGPEAQIEQAWRNVLSVLDAAGMGPRDLVKVTTFLISRADLPTARAVRDRMLQGAAPASTLIFVPGLASPDWLVEIEGVAAAA
jgi:enamine deaminase RidA (YjgF/YER057c/UK114 family)